MRNLILPILLFISCTDQNDNILSVQFIDSLPDFSRIKDLNERKATFFSFLSPLVEHENMLIDRQRSKVIFLFEQIQKQSKMIEEDSAWISDKALEMNIINFDMYSSDSRNELLTKLDYIPVALVLAQAANESSWGTSRFAVEANNLFGQYCYSSGCGIVPKNRPKGGKFEVRKFISVNESIASYLRNINRNYAYSYLRSIRSKMRTANNISSIELAKGLENYSIRRKEYVKEIQSIILVNNLETE